MSTGENRAILKHQESGWLDFSIAILETKKPEKDVLKILSKKLCLV